MGFMLAQKFWMVFWEPRREEIQEIRIGTAPDSSYRAPMSVFAALVAM